MNEIQKIYETELAEVGYLEKASNAYLDDKTKNAGYNNITKYWRDFRKMGRMAIYGYFAGSGFVGGASWSYCAAGLVVREGAWSRTCVRVASSRNVCFY